MASEKDLRITPDDRNWVHESFKWMIDTYGYPKKSYKPILFTKEFFPKSFEEPGIDIEPIIEDLCVLMGIDPAKVAVVIEKDIRDIEEMPYLHEGHPKDSELEIINIAGDNCYLLHFANLLLKHPDQLLFNCTYQIIQVRMLESGIIEEVTADDLPFVYLQGIFVGLDFILAKTSLSEGSITEGSSQRSWKFASPFPITIMGYAMALYDSLTENLHPQWFSSLPADIQKEYNAAAAVFAETPHVLFNKRELQSVALYDEAGQHYISNLFDEAIKTYQKALFVADRDFFKADIHNDIGYSYLRKQQYSHSIPHFQKAIEYNSVHGYAYDNMGHAFIMNGDLDTGKYYLHLALGTASNDEAYSLRNLGLYHQKKGALEEAEACFLKAFDNIRIPVDLLEFFYGQLLLEQGKTEEALKWLQKAVDKKEPEAIAFMEQWNRTGN